MSWASLAGSDPLPGEPAQIAAYADDLERTADLIQDQVIILRRLAEPGNRVADAADAFRNQAGEVAGDIDTVTASSLVGDAASGIGTLVKDTTPLDGIGLRTCVGRPSKGTLS